MRITKVNNNFYLHIRRGGKSIRVSLHTSNRRTAEKNAQHVVNMMDKEKSQKILSGHLVQYAVSLARGEIQRQAVSCAMEAIKRQAEIEAIEVISHMMEDFPVGASYLWDRYMETVDKSIVKQVTIDGKRSKLDVFAKWAGDIDYKTVTTDSAKKFLDSLGCSNQTRNNYVSDLSTIWQSSGITNPWVSSLRKHADHKESTPVDTSKLHDLITWCNNNKDKTASGIDVHTWARFTLALYYSGLRPVDVALLTFGECVDGHIELTPTKTSRTRKKVSYIPDKRFFDCIKSNIIPVPSAYVFPGIAELYRHNRSNLATALRTLQRMAGIDGINFYQIRHYWVTHQVKSGVEIDDVAAAVGHSSTSTTEGHYYHGKHDIRVCDMPDITDQISN